MLHCNFIYGAMGVSGLYYCNTTLQGVGVSGWMGDSFVTHCTGGGEWGPNMGIFALYYM